jgi:electron transfer flavoprotein beta subunit
MKILVAVKRAIDANVKVRVKADQTAVDLTNVKMAMNPFCEIAAEEAIRLKEKGFASEVVVVSVGSDKSQEQLRTAMALGADRAILVNTGADAVEPLSVAKLLKSLVEKEKPDLVILGKQSIDSDNNQVAQMLSALSDMPQGTFAFKLEINNGRAIVSREVDGGEQTLSLSLPAVISTDLRLNEPRYARLPDIMRAKKKPLQIYSAEELGVKIESRLTTLSVTEPEPRPAGVIVQNCEELIDKLKNEARVLS